MNSEQLAEELNKYIGRRVRIWSQLTGPGITWRPGDYNVLQSVVPATLPNTAHTRVWLTYDDGLAYQVDDDKLLVELEPAVGTYDFAQGRDQMEAIATALRRFGPTAKTMRTRCSCVTCSAQHQLDEAIVQETFKDAWNHGPTDPELNLEGW